MSDMGAPKVYGTASGLIASFGLFVGYLVGWQIQFDDQLYILSGVGAIALLLLLAGLGKKNHELEKQKILRGVALGMAAAETAGLIA